MTSPDDFRVKMRAMAVREWPIVLLAVAAAAVVAALAASGASTRYEGRATIAVNPVSIAATPRIPKADMLLREITTSDFKARIEKAAGGTLGSDAKLGTYKAFSEGDQQERLVITYTATDRAEAGSVTEAISDLVLERAKELSAPETARQQGMVDAAQEAVDRAVKIVGSAAKTKDLADTYYLWSVKSALADSTGQLRLIEVAYTPAEPVEVSTLTAGSMRGTSAAGGALVGLFVGLGIAWLREILIARSARAVD